MYMGCQVLRSSIGSLLRLDYLLIYSWRGVYVTLFTTCGLVADSAGSSGFAYLPF